MSNTTPAFAPVRSLIVVLVGLSVAVGVGAVLWMRSGDHRPSSDGHLALAPRLPIETSGFGILAETADPWEPTDSLSTIAEGWRNLGDRRLQKIEAELRQFPVLNAMAVSLIMSKALCFNYEGKPNEAYATVTGLRSALQADPQLENEFLATVLYVQGVCALRRGENDNCILCRGESSCILPIRKSAIHTNPEGSRLAVQHFTEYLEHFPDDLEAQWLLNIAHMTLGEHPHKVDPRHLISLDDYNRADEGIGRFRDIGHLVGINRFNQSGGAVMEDFDNDGLLDVFVTSIDPTQMAGLYRNNGNGHFEDRSTSAGLAEQLGGLNCVQTDYNNDGLLDLYIPRGAWLNRGIRPSLLRNEGQFRFADVTSETGLLDPVNSNAAAWADYDNDGWLDLFVCCEKQPHRLFRNQGDGTFKNVSSTLPLSEGFGKGCTWIDYDNDDYPDLFVQYLDGTSQLIHNERNGTFQVATPLLGEGTRGGFSCWAFDYDNDGWLDIFAPSYDRTLGDVVRGLIGEPHNSQSNRLFRNREGRGFQDVAPEAGLDVVHATMGSNYGDFDNDGYLDMYLGTGEPNLATLVPNRMLRNLGGTRFVDITGSAGVGNLQKGHGVGCGDWDRDGNVDIFIQMGGVAPGDRYHNILFQNPGHTNQWLTVKLVGQQSNRAAIGARIKVVTGGEKPLTLHRHVSSGSSFGGNPLEQTIGLAQADRVALLEIRWPTSKTTQVFRDVPVNQSIEITEFQETYRTLDQKRVPVPKSSLL